MLKSGEKLQKLLMLLVTWALLLAGFVAYQQYFVKHQESFFREQGFRALNRLSSELEYKFDEAQASTESFVKLVKSGTGKNAAKNAGNFLDVYQQGLQSNDKAVQSAILQSAMQCWPKDHQPQQVPLESKQDRDGLTLSVYCFTPASPKDSNLPDHSHAKLLYTLDLEGRIRKGFEEQGSDFEDVLVADSSGHVVLQESNAGPRIADLKSLLTDNKDGDSSLKAKASSADATQNNGPQEGASGRNQRPVGKDSAPASPRFPELSKLNDASSFSNVTIADEPYKMFSQPVQISLDKNLPGAPPLKLILAGLRHSSRFTSQTHALPYSSVIWAGLIIVALFSLSWPLFKLHYMSASERFTPKDGWFLIITIFLAATSVTLILLNASYINQAQKETDTHLQALAYRIKQHFMVEMLQEYAGLQRLTDSASKVDPGPIPNYLDSNQAKNDQDLWCNYPYFEIAAWMDNTGQQVSKFDVRAASTPFINLKDQDFFKDIFKSKAQAASARRCMRVGELNALTRFLPFQELKKKYLLALEPTHFQPLFSPSTNEFSAVLSSAVPVQLQKDGRLKVAALTSRPMSLVNPILPPGYKFAVIDAACKVLFHFDATRDGRENFCEESESAGELKPWLFSGIDNSLDISYAGQSERAYLTSLDLPGTSSGEAFLIVFQDADRQLTLNLAIILVCSILLGVYAVALLCGAGIHLGVRKLYAPNFIWPCREQAIKYMQLGAAVGAMLVLFWTFYPWLYEAPLLFLSVGTPVLSLLFGVFKLCDWQKLLRITARVLFAAGVVGFLLSCFLEATSWRDWCWVFVFFIACGIIAYFLSGTFYLPRRLGSAIFPQYNFIKDLARSYFVVLYVGAALAMITAVALVPTLGFFKYAYDAVSELALKHDQAEVADRVLDRFHRIRDYYDYESGVKGPRQIIADRIQLNWDRYDKYDQTFAEVCDPQLPEESSDARSKPCSEDRDKDKDKPITSEAFNQRIEKWIAQATLRFPANQLGSEMSKLGVAGSDTLSEKPAWSRVWREDDPTKFTLTWKDSRMSGFSVTSNYRRWDGLWWLAKSCLIPLAMVLGVWLITVVKKIFLTDFEGTLDHDDVDWKMISDIRKSVLIIGPAKTGKTKWLRELLAPYMNAQKLAAAAGSASSIAVSGTSPSGVEWRDLRSNLTETCAGQAAVLVLDHFEFNLRDRQCNLARLKLLEGLLYNSECKALAKVLVISAVDPLFYLTEGAPEMLADKEDPAVASRLLDRWARVLSKLTRVRLKDSDEKKFLDTNIADFKKEHESHGQHKCCRHVGDWVARECSHTAMLREIGADILKEFNEDMLVTQELVVRKVLERADLYYHVLWSGMTASERLVLYQLALDGWANPKNVAALQQLERKSLISRAPMYKIMNESFRRFIESAEHAEEIAQWAKNERQSTWHALRVVASAAAIGIVVWLVYSQAALSQALTGYVAGIATLLTAVASLFGRSGKTTPPKAEDKAA